MADNLNRELNTFFSQYTGTKTNTSTPHKTVEEGAKRFDTDKLRMDLLPVEWMVELSNVLTEGAKKYDDNNWRKGMDWSRCIGSLYRHLTKWQSGITFDTETQCHHLAHVAWNALALMVYQMEGLGKDDRQVNRYREEDWKSK